MNSNISCKNLHIYLMFLTFGLSSILSSPTCFISAPFVGEWIQPGLVDLITINNTWCSFKGTCLSTVGPHHVKNKFIFYNEQTRCKRCVLFISRHENALQYRESECFDADDDNGRICGSITPDTVLYTLFRDNAESIPCPFEQSWFFEKDRQISHVCQAKAFHQCSIPNTFQLSYNNRCENDQDVRATCLARFTDGNINYVVARSVNQQKFVCFSYIKTKSDDTLTPPTEVYLSADDNCRDLLTRESAIALNVIPNTHHRHFESVVQLPDWLHGRWLTSGINTNVIYLNNTQLIMKINDEQTILYDIKLTRLMSSRRHQENIVRVKGKSLEQCSSIFYCMKFVYRSSSVIDLSIGFDEHGCKDSHLHFTLFKPSTISNISCPQMGIYKSLSSYRPSIPVSSCSSATWTLSLGCETANKSELTFSSTCRHETVPDVQVITSVKGLCLATWRTDNRFQRTIILYEQTRAFCLIQPLKSHTASWILSDSSCINLGYSSIKVDNSLRYSQTCTEYRQTSSSSLYLSSNCSTCRSRFSYLLFSLLFVRFLCKYSQ